MPEPQVRRPRIHGVLGAHCRRRPRAAAYLTVTGVLGLALTPAFASGAAVANTAGSPCYAPFSTTSAADMVVVRQFNLAPIGSSVVRPTQVLIGSSRAGLYAGASPLAAARAGLFGPEDIRPDSYVYQVAPPSGQEPAIRTVSALDDGSIHTGTRRLSSRAALSDPGQCDDAAAEASVDALTASSIDGDGNGSMLRLAGQSGTLTQAGFITNAGYYAVAGAATATVADLSLLGASIRVTGTPSLRVAASGFADSSTVRYQAASLSVSTADTNGYRPVTDHLDLVAPINPSGATEAAKLVRADAAEQLSPGAFGDFLRAFGACAPTSITRDDGTARTMVVRVGPGPLVQENYGWMVHGLASAVRLQVLLRSTTSHGSTESQLAEITVGTVEVMAFAPYGGLASNQQTTSPTIIDVGGSASDQPKNGTDTTGQGTGTGGQNGTNPGSTGTGGSGQGTTAQPGGSGAQAGGSAGQTSTTNQAAGGRDAGSQNTSASGTGGGAEQRGGSRETSRAQQPPTGQGAEGNADDSDGDTADDSDGGDQAGTAAGSQKLGDGGKDPVGLERPTSLHDHRLRLVIGISTVVLAAAFGLMAGPSLRNLVTIGARRRRRRH